MQAANRLPAAASIPRCGNGSHKNTRTEGQQAHTKHHGTLSGRFYSRGHRAMRSVDDAPAFEAAIVIHGIREGIRPGVPVVASLIVAAPFDRAAVRNIFRYGDDRSRRHAAAGGAGIPAAGEGAVRAAYAVINRFRRRIRIRLVDVLRRRRGLGRRLWGGGRCVLLPGARPRTRWPRSGRAR